MSFTHTIHMATPASAPAPVVYYTADGKPAIIQPGALVNQTMTPPPPYSPYSSQVSVYHRNTCLVLGGLQQGGYVPPHFKI